MNRSRFKPRALLLALGLTALAIVAGVRSSLFFAAPPSTIPPEYFIVNDAQGPGDQPGQKDLTRMGRANDTINGITKIFFSLDDLAPSGGNTQDVCALFDVAPTDGKVDYAFCVEIANVGGVPKINTAAGYPKLFHCDNTLTLNCGGGTPLAIPASFQYGDLIGLDPNADLTTATDPWSGDDYYPYDSTVALRWKTADMNARLANVCTYPSASLSSDASDCLANEGGGFLQIVKNTVGGDGSATFNVTPVPSTNDGAACVPAATNCKSYTVATSGGTGSIGLSLAKDTIASIQEAAPGSQWDFTSAGCTVEGGGSAGTLDPTTRTISGITIIPDTVTTCTFVNSRKPATVTVTKVVTNDNGGTAAVSDFTLRVGDTVVTSGSPKTFPEGTYTITETGPTAGYAASFSGNCSLSSDGSVKITVVAGGTYSCTITNNDIAPSLTLSKQVSIKYGGTASSTDFTLSAAGPTPISGGGGASSGSGFKASTYTLSESGPSGYTASPWVCTGGSLSGNKITLGIGQSATCTITNTDTPPTLVVVKQVNNNNGGTATPSAFSGTISGAVGSFTWSGASTTRTLASAGAYTVKENAVVGYTASYSPECSGSLAAGETKTCTVTNQDQQGTLTIIKHVVNDNGGGATASQFNMVVTGGHPSKNNFAGSEAGVVVNIDAGSYSVDESGGPSGYKKSLSAGCSGTMAVGGSATCTITNDDIAPTLVVVKQVVNTHGGTAAPSAFSGSISGTAGSSTWSGASTTRTLTVGDYKVTETPVTGYTASYSPECTGSLAAGQTVTCTVTNQDQPGTLTVIKHVINDNGGAATADQFTMVITAGHPTSNNFAGSEDGVNVTIDAGSYSVNETGGPSGYAKSLSAGCSGAMPVGGSATCTITNNDIAPKLTVTKIVNNNNGGTALPSAWTLSATGAKTISGPGGATSDATFTAGAYTLSESGGPSGYTASAWSCTGGALSGSQITVKIGETANCSITNDDIKPTLTLVKFVSNGGINDPVLPPSVFNLAANGPTSFSGSTGVTSNAAFKAGTYTLGESGPSGYTSSAWACSGDGVQTGNQIALGIAQTATCAITNTLNNISPSIRIEKSVTPKNLDSSGGTVTFTVTITNLSGAYDPFTITQLTDTIYGDLTNPLDAKPQDNNQCGSAVGTTIAGGDSYTCTWTSYFPPLPTNETLSEHDVVTVVGHDDDNAGPSSQATASADATVTQAMPIVITNGSCEIDTFRRIYTQDLAYYYTSTNPGQFFFNAAISGTPGEMRHVTIELPWPFVTQSSQPISVHDSVDWVNGCFTNWGNAYSIQNLVYLKDYGVSLAEKTGYLPTLKTRKVEVEVKIPASGFAILTQHLDDGIKGTAVDFNGDGILDNVSYGVDNAQNGTDPATGKILIPEGFSHPFTMWGFTCSASDPGCSIDPAGPNVKISGGTTFTNDNDFQKYVGVNGTVLYNGAPAPGMTVQLKSGNTLMGASLTDANGQYVIAYKQTSGKDKYTVTLVNPLANATVLSGGATISGMPGSTSKSVNLKSNGTATVDFPLLP
jgi:hypothetical protein